MLHKYFPHTAEDIAKMLEVCHATDLKDLYSDVPEQLKLNRDYNLAPQKSEKEVRDFFEELAQKNQPQTCFAGAGFYDHYAPSVIQSIISRSEFLTAYTPYQPEISQGTLQYIFEYQTMMTQLTGLEVSNASMYDGTTAVAEAMLMSVASARKKNRVLISATVNPIYREVVDTYAHYHGVTIDTIPEKDGITDLEALKEMLTSGDVAGVILATPNFYGILEDYTGVADMVHASKALLIMTAPASALGVIKTPAEWGADIAAGEAQSLGMPMNFGGPYLGYMCCTKALIRKLPGRIVGATTDVEGQRVPSFPGAHYLASKLQGTGAFELKYPDKPFLNEFVMKFKGEVSLDDFIEVCSACGCLPGVKIGENELLICVTEMRTHEELDRYIWRAETFSKAKVPSFNTASPANSNK